MPINEGKTERAIRVVAGLFLLVLLPIVLPGSAKWWGLVGLLPLITGLIGYCPAWALFGINTCSIHRGDGDPHRE
ncbi:MAG: DUF2892 domain-containing protein [Candidatus Methylacidiphilaceae bacterium]